MQISRRVSLCQICGQLANGNHFGVISCRACAAFFRRANVESDTFCALGNCQINKNGKFYCKKCRLRKCLEMGMDVGKFQHDRDLISTSTSTFSPDGSESPPAKKRKPPQIPPSLATFLGRPAFILSCEPEKACRVKTLIDVTFLINQAMEILRNGDSRKYIGHDSLEKMALKFGELKRQKPNFKLLRVLGMKETIHFWEQDFLYTAAWLTHFEEFQELPLNIKMQILKVGWKLWGRLDKLAKTADERRKQKFGNSVYMIGDEVCLDLKEFEVDISWCTNYSKDQLTYYLDCHHDEYFNIIVDLLIDLHPTDIELNYMLIELCLHYAGKRHQGEVLKLTDKLLEVISNNLHNYYKSDLVDMPAPLFLSGPCEICGQKTTGRHFGVMSCRACAAFFRRAAAWMTKKRTECPKGDCKIFDDGKFQCKKCRLKRCLDVGMDVNKFQSNRDLISSSNKFMKRLTLLIGPPNSLASFLGRPMFILCCEPDKATAEKTIIDVTFLVDIAGKMFRKDPTLNNRPFQYHNSLEKLAFTLEDMRTKEPDTNIKQLTKLGKDESLYIWEQSFLRVVEWFANFPEFNELEDWIKLEIVKNAWIAWTRLDKLTETAEYQRKKFFSDDMYMVGNDSCLEFRNFEVDLTWCTNYSLEQLAFYLMPEVEQNCKQCVQDLVDLSPSSVEICYMLLQVTLYHAGKKCQGKVLEATERLIASQADHLHDYYTNKMKLKNYSGRLAKLMKINRGIEADMRDRAEKNEIARVFNIMKVEFSHPDMFEST